MAVDLFAGPFGHLLPRPTNWTKTVLSLDAQESPAGVAVDTMQASGPLTSDMPMNDDQGQQLPSVSHILGVSGYGGLPSSVRPSSISTQQETPIFRHLYYNHGNLGDVNGPTPSASYRQTAESLIGPKHFRQSSEAMAQSPYSHGPLREPATTQVRPMASLPSPRAVRPTSGHHTVVEEAPMKRVLREENIPGHGFCYIYDDGSYCPKAIGGSNVNPQWGVTKAGKPRKRLAQACSTCREKKIRCDPSSGHSKCAQCLKFHRECRFEILSRSGQRSPSLTSTTNSPAVEVSSGPSPTSYRDSITSTDQSYVPATSSKTSFDVGTSSPPFPFRSITNGDAADQSKPSKKQKQSASRPSTQDDSASQTSELKRRRSDIALDTVDEGPPEASPMWDTDPFEYDAEMTEYYLNEYFTKINSTMYCIFPRQPFMKWVRECRKKSSWDKMLLYAMLAHASIFATDRRRKADGDTFFRIAHQAVSRSTGEFLLQVVQTRLILALYDFSQGGTSTAWDRCGSAIRAAYGMRLNVEEGVLDIKKDQVLDYGFEKATLIECRRRTFWAVYIVDRFNGLCPGHQAMIDNADCLLRLPCNEAMYEEGNIPQTPFFDDTTIDPQQLVHSDRCALGMMAFLVQIASIWGEVLVRAYRSRHQPPSAYGAPFENSYKETKWRLDAWERSLSAHLKSSTSNIDKADASGQLGTYGVLQTLYHFTAMKLNRHARCEYLDRHQIDHNVKEAYDHACKTLDLMRALTRQHRNSKSGRPGFALGSAFTGFAILTAIDILTATGSLADLLNPDSRSMALLAGGIDIMSELAEHWSSAKTQLDLVADRYANLLATVQSHGAGGKTRVSAFFAKEPLELGFGLEYDLIYSLPRKRYLEALGWGAMIRDDDEMLEIQKRGSRVNTVALSRTSIWTLDES